MGMLRMMAAIIAVASVGANLYFAKHFWANPNDGGCSNVTIDEPIVMRTKGGMLEVSRLNATEQFQATANYQFFGLYLGQNFSQIRVPASYFYRIPLAPEWKMLHRDNTYIVIAPAVQPANPVAIDLSKLQALSLGIWSPFVGQAHLAQLQRSITPVLAEKANSPRYIALQRESARQTVREFVVKWLLTQEKWKSVSPNQVQVFFSDEPINTLAKVKQSFGGVFSN